MTATDTDLVPAPQAGQAIALRSDGEWSIAGGAVAVRTTEGGCVMPDVRKFFDKDFLYAYDLEGRDVTLTIERVVQGEFVNKGKKDKKPAIYFKGTKKALGCNITNVRTIAGMYGYKTEDWIGKRITIFPTTTQFGSETKECIRVRPKIPGQAVKDSKPPTDPEPAREPGGDDDKGDAPSDEELRSAGVIQ